MLGKALLFMRKPERLSLESFSKSLSIMILMRDGVSLNHSRKRSFREAINWQIMFNPVERNGDKSLSEPKLKHLLHLFSRVIELNKDEPSQKKRYITLVLWAQT